MDNISLIRQYWWRRMSAFLPALLLAACVAPPAMHTAKLRDQAPLPVSSNTASSGNGGQWPAANWWTQYQDETLTALITQALKGAPSLSSAEARFTTARETVRLVDADGLHIDASGDVSRQRLSDNGLFPPKILGFNWYNQADLGLRGSYEFDWWHKRSDNVAAAIDDAHATQAQRDAAAMSISVSIAQSYFGWQADQAQISILEQQQQFAEKRRDIIKARVAAELEPIDGVYSADAEIAALHEAIVGGQYSAQLRRVAIAALMGVSVDALPAFTAHSLPTIATQLPDNVSIDLLARRADISASRSQVEAAQQRLHAARADFFPDISINALAGLSSIELSKLLETGSAVPSIGFAVHLPIFDAGHLRAQYGLRGAQVNAAINTYNETVVNAAREVAMYTVQLQQLAAQRTEREKQRNAASNLFDIAVARNQQGLSDARARLMASQSLQQQLLALVNLDAATITAQLNLILALGGGYQATNDHIALNQSVSDQTAGALSTRTDAALAAARN